jgi:hypothetical protein
LATELVVAGEILLAERGVFANRGSVAGGQAGTCGRLLRRGVLECRVNGRLGDRVSFSLSRLQETAARVVAAIEGVANAL